MRCTSGHAYDVARQGYVSLLTGAGTRGLTADDADMVAARERVQGAGLFAPVAAALSEALSEHLDEAFAQVGTGGALIDVGGGTGYYAAACLGAPTPPDAGESAHNSVRLGVSLDLSRYAARRAARAHPRLASVVADAWAGLPVRDEAAAAVLCVFAPRNAAEFARVLSPGGVLAVVTPAPGHLGAVTDLVDGDRGRVRIDPDKSDRLAAQLRGWRIRSTRRVEATMRVDGAAAADLLLMGPAAWHVDRAATRARLAEGPGLDVGLAVDLTVASPDG